jgi:WD40 repeat protein
LVAGGYRQPIRLWEVATGKVRRKFGADPIDGGHVALSPDGRTLAADASIKGICVWDLPTGLELGKFEMFAPQSLAFSPDGLRLASGDPTAAP